MKFHLELASIWSLLDCGPSFDSKAHVLLGLLGGAIGVMKCPYDPLKHTSRFI